MDPRLLLSYPALATALDAAFVEHDTYAMFEKIMQVAGRYTVEPCFLSVLCLCVCAYMYVCDTYAMFDVHDTYAMFEKIMQVAVGRYIVGACFFKCSMLMCMCVYVCI